VKRKSRWLYDSEMGTIGMEVKRYRNRTVG
jgi:hypothetical protein